MTDQYFCHQWQINETTRLSGSRWVRKDGLTVRATAILRLSGGEWVIDHSTAIEAVNPYAESDWRHDDFDYRWTAISSDMARAEYAAAGQEMPVRFYRDNLIDHNPRNRKGGKK